MSSRSFNTAKSSPWLMLAARAVLFFLFQLVIAIILTISGTPNAFAASSKWWPVSVFLTNVICAVLLDRLYKREGLRFWDIFRINKATVKSDLICAASAFSCHWCTWLFSKPFAGQVAFRRQPYRAGDVYPAAAPFGNACGRHPFPDHTGFGRTAHLFWLCDAAP